MPTNPYRLPQLREPVLNLVQTIEQANQQVAKSGAGRIPLTALWLSDIPLSPENRERLQQRGDLILGRRYEGADFENGGNSVVISDDRLQISFPTLLKGFWVVSPDRIVIRFVDVEGGQLPYGSLQQFGLDGNRRQPVYIQPDFVIYPGENLKIYEIEIFRDGNLRIELFRMNSGGDINLHMAYS